MNVIPIANIRPDVPLGKKSRKLVGQFGFVNVMATRAAITKAAMIPNCVKLIALPTIPVCEEPLMLTMVNMTIAITANNFSRGIPNVSSIISADFYRCPKNVPNAIAYRLPAIVCANHAIQPLRYEFGLGSPSFTHLYPPPVAGKADPSSA